jgi:hypothetical protein
MGRKQEQMPRDPRDLLNQYQYRKNLSQEQRGDIIDFVKKEACKLGQVLGQREESVRESMINAITFLTLVILNNTHSDLPINGKLPIVLLLQAAKDRNVQVEVAQDPNDENRIVITHKGEKVKKVVITREVDETHRDNDSLKRLAEESSEAIAKVLDIEQSQEQINAEISRREKLEKLKEDNESLHNDRISNEQQTDFVDEALGVCLDKFSIPFLWASAALASIFGALSLGYVALFGVNAAAQFLGLAAALTVPAGFAIATLGLVVTGLIAYTGIKFFSFVKNRYQDLRISQNDKKIKKLEE